MSHKGIKMSVSKNREQIGRIIYLYSGNKMRKKTKTLSQGVHERKVDNYGCAISYRSQYIMIIPPHGKNLLYHNIDNIVTQYICIRDLTWASHTSLQTEHAWLSLHFGRVWGWVNSEKNIFLSSITFILSFISLPQEYSHIYCDSLRISPTPT